MKRNQINETTTLPALGLVIILGAVAHAGLPYLPLTGPPSLRMLAKNPNSAEVFRLANGKQLPATNTLAKLEAGVVAMPTNQPVWPGTTNLTATGPLQFIGSHSDNPLADARTAAIFAMPTADLLSITPQMLATYFQPITFGTNVSGFVGPYPVGFRPPLPETENPSRAEYIVK